MKFAAAILALAATATALPGFGGNMGAGNDKGNKGNSNVKFPVPHDMTVKQAQAKCGDKAQVSCCNKATWAGDTTTIDKGILSGVLSNAVGSGSASEGLGLFQQCSKLPVNLGGAALPLQDLVDQKCKQNIACCQNSPSDSEGDVIGLGLPCIALGALL